MKTMTVKGIGNVSVKPDLVVLSMSLETRNRDYETAMREAADRIEHINASLSTLGFEKESVKTTDFNVRTDYESKKDRAGNQPCLDLVESVVTQIPQYSIHSLQNRVLCVQA